MNVIWEGIFAKNPVFKLILGLAPAVAITHYAYNGLVLGVTTAIVLLVAAVISSLLKPVISKGARPILHLATLAILTMGAYSILLQLDPQVVASLGIFLPLIVVNGFVLNSLESGDTLQDSVMDAVGKGLGFILALVVIGIVREFLAYGTIFNVVLLEATLPPLALAATVPGGMIILGLLLALYNGITGQGGELSE